MSKQDSTQHRPAIEDLESRALPASLTFGPVPGSLLYTADPGEVNNLTISWFNNPVNGQRDLVFTDNGVGPFGPVVIWIVAPITGGNAPGVPAVVPDPFAGWFPPLAVVESHLGDLNDALISLAAEMPMNADGGSEDDWLTGSSAARNTLFGGTGNDWLAAGGEIDLVKGGLDDDVLGGNGASDSLYGGSGADRLHGGAGNDYLEGGLGADRLEGDDDNDTLNGGGAFNSSDSGAIDTLVGGTGADVFVLGWEDVFEDFNPFEGDTLGW
jgi:Ca2+-binding RTX toxin-like protein